ncbi:MAG: hypothetical protein ACR2LE_08520 [Nocardioidaceae bacterium]
MSWIKPVGKKAVKYGPQVQLLWKHAGRPVTTAAQAVLVSATARRSALKHADTVVEGAILEVFRDGRSCWVVYSASKPVASYPPVDDLQALVADAHLSKKMTPDQLRTRQAGASRRRKVVDAGRNVGEQIRRRGSSF